MTTRITPSTTEARDAQPPSQNLQQTLTSPAATATEVLLTLDTRLSTVHLRLTNDRTLRTLLGNLPAEVVESTLGKFQKARLRRGVRVAFKVERLLGEELRKLQGRLEEVIPIGTDIWKRMEQIEGESMELGAREALECERELKSVGDGDESLQRLKDGVEGLLRLVKLELEGGKVTPDVNLTKAERREKVKEWKEVPSKIDDDDDRFERTPSEYSDDDGEHPAGTWYSEDEKEKPQDHKATYTAAPSHEKTTTETKERKDGKSDTGANLQPKEPHSSQPYKPKDSGRVPSPHAAPTTYSQQHQFPSGRPPHSHAPVIDATRDFISDSARHTRSTRYPPQSYPIQPLSKPSRPPMIPQGSRPMYAANAIHHMHHPRHQYDVSHGYAVGLSHVKPPPPGYPGTEHRPPPGYPGTEPRKPYPTYQSDEGIFQRQYPHAERQAAERAYMARAQAAAYSQQRAYPAYAAAPVDSYGGRYDPYADARAAAYATAQFTAEGYGPPHTHSRSAPHGVAHTQSRSVSSAFSQPVPMPHTVPHEHNPHIHQRSVPVAMPQHGQPRALPMPQGATMPSPSYGPHPGTQSQTIADDFARLTEMYRRTAEDTVKNMQQLQQRQQMETAQMTAQLNAQVAEYQQQSAHMLAQMNAQVSQQGREGYKDMVDAFGNLRSR